MFENYTKEISELKRDIENIIEESIENYKNSILENLKNEKFVNFISFLIQN